MRASGAWGLLSAETLGFKTWEGKLPKKGTKSVEVVLKKVCVFNTSPLNARARISSRRFSLPMHGPGAF